MKLTAEEVTAYLHRIEVGNPDGARWSVGRIAEHIAALEAELAECARQRRKFRLERDGLRKILLAVRSELGDLLYNLDQWDTSKEPPETSP